MNLQNNLRNDAVSCSVKAEPPADEPKAHSLPLEIVLAGIFIVTWLLS